MVGSAHMFSDAFIHKEKNETVSNFKKYNTKTSLPPSPPSRIKLFNVIIQWLTGDDIQLNQIDSDDPEVHVYI